MDEDNSSTIYIVSFAVALFLLFVLHVLTFPGWLLRLGNRKWPDILFRVDTEKQVLALTIDDGPTESCGDLLDVLKRYDVKATWFIISSHAEEHPALMKRIIDEGHEVANHGIYDEKHVLLGEDAIRDNIDTCQQVLQKFAEKKKEKSVQKYYRPGGGLWNSAILKVCREWGYRVVLGSAYPFDAGMPRLPAFLRNGWLRAFGFETGGIVILHDRPETPSVMAQFLIDARRRRYDVMPLSKVLEGGTLESARLAANGFAVRQAAE